MSRLVNGVLNAGECFFLKLISVVVFSRFALNTVFGVVRRDRELEGRQ